jgi:hypothetical protein
MAESLSLGTTLVVAPQVGDSVISLGCVTKYEVGEHSRYGLKEIRRAETASVQAYPVADSNIMKKCSMDFLK